MWLSECRKLAAITGLLLVAGCGFHLQGPQSLPATYERIYVAADDRHSEFYRELRRRLQSVNTTVVDNESQATAVLTVYVDDTDQRVLSVSARNVPTEYEVYYTVRYGVSTGSEVIVEARDVTLTRDYTYDSRLVLGKAREEQVLRSAIVRDLVNVVLQQMSQS